MASYLLDNLLKTKDTTHYVTGGDGRGSQIPSAFANYVGTDYILFTSPQYPSSLPYSYSDNEFIGSYSSNSGQYGYVLFPFIPTSHLGKIEFDFKLSVNGSAGSFGVYLVDNSLDTSSTGKHIILYYQSSPSSMSDYQHYEISVPEGRQDIAYSYLMLNFSSTVKCNIKNMAFLSRETSNGGGATHIAKVTGQLKDLSSNLSDILMVSGGGGGGLLLGDSGWHGTEQNIAWSGNNNKLTVQLDDDDVLFKMYIGSSNIYSFTAPVSDINNIYLQFLIDSENEVAKPSFVYKNGSSYSFNQEEPTDAEMQDIYTWLSAGTNS